MVGPSRDDREPLVTTRRCIDNEAYKGVSPYTRSDNEMDEVDITPLWRHRGAMRKVIIGLVEDRSSGLGAWPTTRPCAYRPWSTRSRTSSSHAAPYQTRTGNVGTGRLPTRIARAQATDADGEGRPSQDPQEVYLRPAASTMACVRLHLIFGRRAEHCTSPHGPCP